MNKTAQKRAGGQDDSAGLKFPAIAQANACCPFAAEQIVGLAFDHSQICGGANRLLHRRAVELAVSLRARPAHRRPFAAIEHSKLDSSGIGDAAHQAVERIDLTDQMAFAQTADRWITRHRADAREALRDERHARSHARGRACSLAAGVAATNHNHIETTIHCFTKIRSRSSECTRSVKMDRVKSVFHVKQRPN
jgi:hypothetical protein